MIAIGAVQQTQPIRILYAQPNTQANRVTQGTKSFFQKAKETAIWAWEVAVYTIKSAGSKVSFVFFRALELINPNLALRMENIFLYLRELKNDWVNGWQQRATQEELATLRSQNVSVRRNLELVTLENHHLRSSKHHLEQVKVVLDQQVAHLQRQQAHIANREGAVVADRNALVEDNENLRTRLGQLQQEKGELTAKNGQLEVAMREIQSAKEGLAQELERVQQELPQMQDALKVADLQRGMGLQLAHIETIAKQQAQRPFCQKSELDDYVEGLLPPLLEQLRTTQSWIAQEKPKIEGTAAEIICNRMERIVSELLDSFAKVPQAFQMHARWQNPLLLTEV